MSNSGLGILGIIPARSGSKGIVKKNIAPLLGKPLIEYTIEAALGAKSLDHVLVSTDDPEVKALACRKDLWVLDRPAYLATDEADSVSVVKHAIEAYSDRFGMPEIVVLLQPTSPLRTCLHIEEAVSMLRSQRAKSVISVCEAVHSPYKSFQMNRNELVPLFSCDQLSARRQDLPRVLQQNGAIYCAYVDEFMDKLSFYLQPALPFIMQNESSVDIDTALDLKMCEIILNGPYR